MSLLFLDSFDHYTNPADKYTNTPGGTIVAGRHGNGLYTPTNDIALAPADTRCLVGGAWHIAWPSGRFYHINAFSNLNPMLMLGWALDGALEVRMSGADGLGTSDIVARSAADVIKQEHWYYIELDVTFSVAAFFITADVCKVYVDGALVLDEVTLGPTSNDYQTDGLPASIWNRVRQAGAVAILDDFYICDGTGPAPWNAPLGDVEIDVIRPNGSGASTQWTATGAPSNWDATNDLTPDAESTRVSAATAGLSDVYAMEDVNTSDGIIGAQLLVMGRRTEEGPAALTPLLRHAGVTTDLVQRSLSASYAYRNRDVFVTMPNGDPLTDANLNALQAGFRRSV